MLVSEKKRTAKLLRRIFHPFQASSDGAMLVSERDDNSIIFFNAFQIFTAKFQTLNKSILLRYYSVLNGWEAPYVFAEIFENHSAVMRNSFFENLTRKILWNGKISESRFTRIFLVTAMAISFFIVDLNTHTFSFPWAMASKKPSNVHLWLISRLHHFILMNHPLSSCQPLKLLLWGIALEEEVFIDKIAEKW